jgi:uncharacterized protein
MFPRDFSVPPFIPRRGFSNGHVQTMASYFLRRRDALPASEDRLIPVAENARVLCRANWQEEKARALTAVIVHGLEGSSDSAYMVSTAAKALAAGMNVVRMNMRNCGGTESLAETLYHSGLASDLAAVVDHLKSHDGLSRFVLLGFSMGGNLVANLLGERGSNAPGEIRAAAVVSPVMDLAPSADALHQGSNRIYEWKFVRGLSRLFRRKARLFPDRYDATRLEGVRSIRDFDERVTAPYNGFRDADDYYARVSSSRCAENISVPYLVIHSADDPFVRILPATRAKLVANISVRYLETARGGHCAFLADPDGYDGRWAERTVVDFLRRF